MLGGGESAGGDARAQLGAKARAVHEQHAARAADLLEAAGTDAVIKLGLGGGLPQLLRPAASDKVLRAMSWEQAAASPGAIVHDSPHPYPDNAELLETFSIPGAEAIYVAFHPRSKTERGHDAVLLTWGAGGARREGPFSGTAFPGCQQRPPLKIEADSFDLHFRSDADTHFWGYRLVAWAAYALRRRPELRVQAIKRRRRTAAFLRSRSVTTVRADSSFITRM